MTPQERKERAAKLSEALEQYVVGLELKDGGMLGDWMVVGSWVFVDEEGEPDAEYFIGFSNGSMLQHHALGLVSKAEDLLINGTGSDDE